ncbi:MAG: hypothetical protein KGQ41_05385 [Alphaproteobacteria bacterium]|nr:hypothetical protein [Alphaproteobacteria bacterium]
MKLSRPACAVIAALTFGFGAGANATQPQSGALVFDRIEPLEKGGLMAVFSLSLGEKYAVPDVLSFACPSLSDKHMRSHIEEAMDDLLGDPKRDGNNPDKILVNDATYQSIFASVPHALRTAIDACTPKIM